MLRGRVSAAAFALIGLGLACLAARGPLERAIGTDELSARWVERATPILVATGLLLLAARAAVEWTLRRAGTAFSPEPRARWLRMLVLGFSSLLLELAFIRWIGAEVRAFAYFKNFVLVAIFLGFGLGFALGPRPSRIFPAALVGVLATCTLVLIWNDASLYPALADQEQTWGHVVSRTTPGKIVFLLAFFLLSLGSFFLALAGTFAALTQEMGSLFSELPRIPAYALNLAGSLLGVIAFNVLAWAAAPPTVWFAVGLAPLAAIVESARLRAVWAASLVATLAIVATVDDRETGSDVLHVWSPYYRVSAGPHSSPLAPGLPSAARYSASVNRELMTMASVLDPKLYEAAHGVPLPRSTYDYPFLLRPDAKRVLVLAVGLGNDVAAAVRVARPERIVAVEVDPAIAKLARLLHPESPFSDPRVELVIDDARHYVRTTGERFDLVLMSFLDSHTLLSAYSQLRTDNFLYTRESFEEIRRVLAPDGVFVVTYATDREWLVARLVAALRAAFGQSPLVGGSGFVLCAAGPGLPPPSRMPPAVGAWLARYPIAQPAPDADFPTDDRPFLTLSSRKLPMAYWIGIVVVLALAAGTVRAAGLPAERIDARFFLLGAAFLLAETRLITIAGLVFGVTWQAVGIAVSLVLVALIAGTLVSPLVPRRGRLVVFGLLVGSILAGQLVPIEALAEATGAGRLALALLVFGPTFLLASIAFAGDFARAPADHVPAALASNLLGSVAGGLLEYQAIPCGIGSLAATAAVLYALAAVAPSRRG